MKWRNKMGKLDLDWGLVKEARESAKKIANELEVSWKTMTHEESNRIMLAILEEYYNRMAEVVDTTDIILQVSFKLNSKNEQRKKKQTIRGL